MSIETTQMSREIQEIPAAVDRLLTAGAPAIAKAKALIGADIPYLMSVARGSSDHACSYLKYACELELGLPMASVGPSVASIYGAKLRVPNNALCLSVSQSGKSPDIVELTRALTEAGATSVAITNDDASPLAQCATATLPICAGPELSVAATKTFVTSMVAGLWLIAELKGNDELLAAIRALPNHLEAATQCDWTMAANAINGQSVLTLGRGPSFAISNEAALKFKETCQIHAESYSSAEVMHGPVSIVERGFPVIGFAAADAAEQSLVDVADALTEKGALAFVTSTKAKKAICLPHQRTDHWLTDPISSVVSFYTMVEKVSTARNVNPDAPRHLNKVTETV